MNPVQELGDEIKAQYERVKEAEKNHDDTLAEKLDRLEELKQNGISIINEYVPDANPLEVGG